MNKNRRNELSMAHSWLAKALDAITDARDDELDCLNNMPESFEGSDRYSAMETAVDLLDEAIDNIRDAQSNVDEAMR